ncbi:Tigger transposable element-derived protein 1 [Chionoecetes opilio]|uniref:Tigger transposable element-derived protein 1 n=1 Tax=Chionoecetes opilio TaxID=41210 RepID=A0A8J4YHN2_CHIOP|nr:Tigger transposable element-derived protein 1 [Chionoecetes opilio]
MNAVWKKLWPECVHNFKGFPEPTPVVREIVNLAHTAGMDEVGEEDIVELLASHDEELSNEDLMAIEQVRALEEETAEEDDPEPQLHLTRKILADVISKFESGIHDIVNNDPKP